MKKFTQGFGVVSYTMLAGFLMITLQGTSLYHIENVLLFIFVCIADIFMATTLHFFYSPDEEPCQEVQKQPEQALLVQGQDSQFYQIIRV